MRKKTLLVNERISDYDVEQINGMRDEIVALKSVIGSLIAWISQSANSPLSSAEARELLRRLEDEGKP